MPCPYIFYLKFQPFAFFCTGGFETPIISLCGHFARRSKNERPSLTLRVTTPNVILNEVKNLILLYTEIRLSRHKHFKLPPDWFEGLVSPRTSAKLYCQNETLCSEKTGECFEISGQVAQLLVRDLGSQNLAVELKAMELLPVFGVSYFREEFLRSVADELYGLVRSAANSPINIMEIGGGDGQFARNFLKFDRTRVFIGDISNKFLELAPVGIRKVCCDACFPYYEEGGLDLAAFWVSLHHLPHESQEKALKVAVRSLKNNGLLVLFEPNTFYLPRHLLLKTRLQKDVYFDDEEKPLDFSALRTVIESAGLKEVHTRFVQPPYALPFLKKLKNWPFYFMMVESLYRIDRHLVLPVSNLLFTHFPDMRESLRKYTASYFFSVYRKTPKC